MTPPIQYKIEIDTNHDGTFAQTVDDITNFVIGDIQTREGMANAYDEVSQPAEMSFTVSNRDGTFNREPVGAELLQNNDFTAWTGGVPDKWEYFGDAASTYYELSQVGQNNFHGEGGAGAVNFYRTSSHTQDSPMMLRQTILTPGSIYRLRLSVTASKESNFDTFKGGSGVIYSPIVFQYGSTTIISISNAGQYEITFIPDSSLFAFGYGGSTSYPRDLNMTVDSVSIVEVKPFYRVNVGTQCRMSAIRNGTTTTLFVGRITAMKPIFGKNAEPLMRFTVKDAMLELLDAEYQAPLLIAPTADTALSRMFDDAVIRWPYSRNYWLLGVAGSSELNISTYLYGHSLDNFETGKTTFSYLGDAADRGEGISAQGYIRDLVAAEAGGRFFWDARNQQFVFHNRHHDALNDTIAATFTENDVDTVDVSYGEDVKNQIVIQYTNRTVGAASSTIWSYPNVPLLMRQNTSRKLTARYFDATDNQLKIGAMDFIQLKAGTDFVANTASNGSGTDVSSLVSVTADFGATAATVFLDNSTDQDVYLTTLQLRGTPLTKKDESTDALDGASIRENELHPAQPLDLRLLDDPDLATQLAQWTLAKFKDPFQRINSLTFNSLRNETTQNALINRVIGDKIAVTISYQSHNLNYVIVGVNRNISSGGDKLCTVTWILKPILREKFWILGVAGKSELDSTTILGI